ncbi:hypothetical protein CEXT_56151, partial [Caerostris extrusa]
LLTISPGLLSAPAQREKTPETNDDWCVTWAKGTAGQQF